MALLNRKQLDALAALAGTVEYKTASWPAYFIDTNAVASRRFPMAIHEPWNLIVWRSEISEGDAISALTGAEMDPVSENGVLSIAMPNAQRANVPEGAAVLRSYWSGEVRIIENYTSAPL